jgi:hypothetical protein
MPRRALWAQETHRRRRRISGAGGPPPPPAASCVRNQAREASDEVRSGLAADRRCLTLTAYLVLFCEVWHQAWAEARLSHVAGRLAAANARGVLTASGSSVIGNSISMSSARTACAPPEGAVCARATAAPNVWQESSESESEAVPPQHQAQAGKARSDSESSEEMEEVELPGVVAGTAAAVEAKQEPDSKSLDLFAGIFGGGDGAARPDAPVAAGASALRGGAQGATKTTSSLTFSGAGPPQNEKPGATLGMGGGSAPRDNSANLSEEEQLQLAIAASLDAPSAAGGRAEVAQQGQRALQRAIAASIEDHAVHSGAAQQESEEEEELEEVSLAVEVDRHHGAERRAGAIRAAAAAGATLVVSDSDSKTRAAAGSAVQSAGGAPLLPVAGCEGERLAAAAVEGEEGEEKEKEEGKEEGNEELGKVPLAAEVKRADQDQDRLDRSMPDHAGGAVGAGRSRCEAEVARGEVEELQRERSPGAGASGKEEEDEGKYEAEGDEVCPVRALPLRPAEEAFLIFVAFEMRDAAIGT